MTDREFGTNPDKAEQARKAQDEHGKRSGINRAFSYAKS